jgi:DNA-binding SARP family transcriptional activator
VDLKIDLVGAVHVRGNGFDRYVDSAQVQVTLTRLCLDRTYGTSRDELADTIWPGDMPATWPSRLRTVLSQVRTLLRMATGVDGDPVPARCGRYRLELPVEPAVDVERAVDSISTAAKLLADNHYEAAAAKALGGVTCLRVPLLPAHDGHWISDTRHRLLEQCLAGLETASIATAAAGDARTAVTLATQAVHAAPWRESSHRCLIRAHAAAGNRAEALRAYEQLRRALVDELGVDPSPPTEALYLQLLGPESSAHSRSEPQERLLVS